MKRVVWFGFGYLIGLATAWSLRRRVRRTVNRFTPEHVRADVGDRSRQAVDRARVMVDDLRDAANEGLLAMRQERTTLLAEFSADEALHTGPARRIPFQRPTARPRRAGLIFRPDNRSGSGRRPSR